MKKSIFWLLLEACIACDVTSEKCTVGDVDFESIGRIHYRTASYLDLGSWGGEDFLLIAEFNGAPWRSGSVAMATGIKQGVIDGDMSSVETTTLDPKPYKFENPNNAKVVPDDVFSGVNAIMIPDGFVIPGHRNGGVYIMV